MKIEDGKIKPCSTCLKVRQAAKTAAGRLLRRRQSPHSYVELEGGKQLMIENEGHTIIGVKPKDALSEYLGRHVYLAGDKVIDVEHARPISALGKIVKVHPIG